MRNAWIAVVLTMLPLPGIAQHVTVLGPGNSSCGDWLARRALSDDTPSLIDQAWVLGFVTSYNKDHGGNVSGTIAPGTLAAWVDRHCKDNPRDSIFGASIALTAELEKLHSTPQQSR